MLEPHAGFRFPISDVQVHAPNESCPRIRKQDDAWRDDATAVQPTEWLGKLKNRLGTNRLARCPPIQVETIQVGFLPPIYIRDRNVEDLGFNFHDAHCGLWKCEKKLGLYLSLIVRRWDIPQLLMVQHGYKH
jgi:hypothetical protein